MVSAPPEKGHPLPLGDKGELACGPQVAGHPGEADQHHKEENNGGDQTLGQISWKAHREPKGNDWSEVEGLVTGEDG